MSLKIFVLALLFLVWGRLDVAIAEEYVFEADQVRLTLTSEGATAGLMVKSSRRELIHSPIPFAVIRKGSRNYSLSRISRSGELLIGEFGKANVKAHFRVAGMSGALVVELVSLEGELVDEMSFAQLAITPLSHNGSLRSVRWDDRDTVCLIGLSDRVDTKLGSNGSIGASIYRDVGLIGEKVAILAVPTSTFLKSVQQLERDYNLPSSWIDGKWGKSSNSVHESYLFTDLTEANVDETIYFAKLAGFKYILIYSSTWSSSLGSYPINLQNFPNGEEGLKAVIDKCHAAGLKVGMHMLTSLVGKNDSLVRPVPDLGLLKDAEATLVKDIEPADRDITATASLIDFPGIMSTYGLDKVGLDIQIDDEIIYYRFIGGPSSSTFLQTIRGHAGTRATSHKAGTKIYHLAERYGSYLADLHTSLKNRIAERIAGLINRCGFDMIYFDGGESNSANGPAWYWVTQQQMAIWNLVKRDLLVQGSGITPWTWHIFDRGTCDDYAAVATKEHLDYYKIAYVRQNYLDSFLPVELGWWGLLDDSPDHPATMPDEVEHYAIRMLALDTPVSLETNMKALRMNGRVGEMLQMLGMYEKLRHRHVVPQSVREKLRSGEWHNITKDGTLAFEPVRYDVKRAEVGTAISVINEWGIQQLKYRLRAVPELAKVGDSSNIVLYKPKKPTPFAPIGPKAVLPGALIERVEIASRQEESSSAFMVGSDDRSGSAPTRTALDLSTHRALAVRLRVDSPPRKSGYPAPVLNIQLESRGKTYRDYYVDLDFIGERTIVIPQPTPERMLREFWPAYSNYAFKAAVYSFDFRNIVAVNFRWMRQSTISENLCTVSLVEALAEKDAVLESPTISVGAATLKIPGVLRSGDYAEYWGGENIRVFDRNGFLLRVANAVEHVTNLSLGENRLIVTGSGTSAVELTTILTGKPLVAGADSQ